MSQLLSSNAGLDIAVPFSGTCDARRSLHAPPDSSCRPLLFMFSCTCGTGIGPPLPITCSSLSIYPSASETGFAMSMRTYLPFVAWLNLISTLFSAVSGKGVNIFQFDASSDTCTEPDCAGRIQSSFTSLNEQMAPRSTYTHCSPEPALFHALAN